MDYRAYAAKWRKAHRRRKAQEFIAYWRLKKAQSTPYMTSISAAREFALRIYRG